MGEAEVYVGWKYVHCSIVGDNFFKFVHTDELIDNIAFFVLLPPSVIRSLLRVSTTKKNYYVDRWSVIRISELPCARKDR